MIRRRRRCWHRCRICGAPSAHAHLRVDALVAAQVRFRIRSKAAIPLMAFNRWRSNRWHGSLTGACWRTSFDGVLPIPLRVGRPVQRLLDPIRCRVGSVATLVSFLKTHIQSDAIFFDGVRWVVQHEATPSTPRSQSWTQSSFWCGPLLAAWVGWSRLVRSAPHPPLPQLSALVEVGLFSNVPHQSGAAHVIF
jgi:hypothetical protein